MTLPRVLIGAALTGLVASAGLVVAAAPTRHANDDAPTAQSAAGLWAPEFAAAIEESSPYEQQILADGVITAAERADALSRMRSCMRDAGYDFRTADDGTSEAVGLWGAPIADSDAVNSARRRCADRFDANVTFLFGEVRRNPERRDDAAITAACLRTAGLVDASYGASDWRRENDTGAFSFDEWAADAVQCRLDPLGLWRGR